MHLAVRAGLYGQAVRIVIHVPRDDIDRACQRTRQVRTRALQDLDAFYQRQGDRDVHRVMTRLRVLQRYAVEQHHDLIKRTATQADIRLRRTRPARAYIYSRDIGQHIRHVRHRPLRYLVIPDTINDRIDLLRIHLGTA